MRATPTVEKRIDLSLELETVLSLSGPVLDAGFDRFFASVLTPGESTCLSPALGLGRRKMEWARRQLIDADAAYLDGVARDADLCTVRDELTSALASRLNNVRAACCTWSEREALLRIVGIDRREGRGPSAVLRQANEVTARILTLELDMATDDWSVLEETLRRLARGMEPMTAKLARTMNELEAHREAGAATAAARQEALEEFNRSYLAVARMAEAMFRAAGRDEEAERVHPTRRQLFGRVDEPIQ